RRILGLRRLTSVQAKVKDHRSTSWRVIRSWDVDIRMNHEGCSGPVSPRLQLLSIRERGSVNGEVTPLNGPTVTVTYNPLPYTTATTFSTMPLPPAPTSGPAWGLVVRRDEQPGIPDLREGTLSMLLDWEDDGLPDLLRTAGDTNCQAL